MGKKSSQKKLTATEPVKMGTLPLVQKASTHKWLKWQCLAVFLTAFALYINTLANEYALDDMIVLTENTFTKQGVEGIDEIMTTDAFHGFFGPNYAFVIGGRYRPLSMVTFAIEYEMFGLEHPWIYHFNNVILYGLTCVLILLTLQKLLRSRYEGEFPWLTIPFIAALIFTAHPIHTEAVSNIKGRDEIMGLLGAIATLYLAIRYAETDKWYYLLLTFPVFLLAVLSKENAITFLAIIPLAYLFFFKDKSPLKGILLALPLIAAVGLYFFIRSSNLPPIDTDAKTQEILNDPFAFSSLADRLATVSYTFGKYLQLLLFPHPLTHDYYPWQVPVYKWSDWQAVLPAVFYVGVLAYTLYYGVTKRSPIAFGVLYFFITISIVSNVLFSVGIAMNERFVFMPSLGFALILAILLVKVTNYIKAKNWNYTTILNAKPLLITLAIVLVGYSAKTITRNPVWKNDYTLFGTDVKNSSNSAKVNNAWGGVLHAAADTAATPQRKNEYLAEAKIVLERAIQIHPTYANAWLLLGNVKYKQGDLQGAWDCYRQAALTNPNSYDAHFNLAILSRDLNKFEEALSYLGQAKSLTVGKNPVDQQKLGQAIEKNRAQIYYSWGKFAGQKQNDLNTAVQKITKAIEIDPTAVHFYEDLGVAYGMMGDFPNAIKASEAGIKIDPNYAPFYLNIAATYNQLGNIPKAQEYQQKAEMLKKK